MLREILEPLLYLFHAFRVVDRVLEEIHEPDQRVLIHGIDVGQNGCEARKD